MANPLISITIPVYNRAAYIQEAIESIVRQRYAPLEIWAVDDGSTDAGAEIIARLAKQLAEQNPPISLHYHYQENQGPAAARNWGIQSATGAFLAFLDADDRWPTGVLHRHMAYLQAHPQTDAVQGMTQPFRANHHDEQASHTSNPFEARGEYEEPTEELGELTWSPKMDSGLFRRAVFDRVGLMDESLRIAEDLDWFLRARECGVEIALLPDVAIEYRRHALNVTNRASATEKAKFQVLQASIRRKRQAAQSTPKNSARDRS